MCYAGDFSHFLRAGMPGGFVRYSLSAVLMCVQSTVLSNGIALAQVSFPSVAVQNEIQLPAELCRRRPTTYTITSLGFELSAINDKGLVVGTISDQTGTAHAVLWQDGRMEQLGTLGGVASGALGVNNEGQVVGYSALDADQSRIHAVLWTDGVIKDLGTLGADFSLATAVNDHGQVVGYSYTAQLPCCGASSYQHAFLWQGGHMQDLGVLGTDFTVQSRANAINDSGQIVGWSDTGCHSTSSDVCGSHAFLWQQGHMQDLGTLGGSSSNATDINNKGQIVGGAATPNSGTTHAFLWQYGKMKDLGTLDNGQNYSEANAITQDSQVVGYSSTAFIWRDGKMKDLNDSSPGRQDGL
jgi:probable HAF family extracellular repeat protein